MQKSVFRTEKKKSDTNYSFLNVMIYTGQVDKISGSNDDLCFLKEQQLDHSSIIFMFGENVIFETVR